MCFFFTESGYITGGVTGSFKGEGLSRILLTYVREPYVLLGHLPVAPTPASGGEIPPLTTFHEACLISGLIGSAAG